MTVDDSAVKTVGLRKRGKLQKVAETGALVFFWIAMGMYAEIVGPTLIDLKFRLNTGYEELATAFAARGFGTFPGCLVGGFLVDKFSGWSHLMVALTLNIAAVAVVLMSWVPNVQYMLILCFISGIFQSIHNTAGTRISLNIWKDKSASPLILVHLGYGIGSFLTPLYSDPFLGTMVQNTTDPDVTSDYINDTRTTVSVLESSNEKYHVTNSEIEYAYAISGVAAASMSFAYFAFQLIENKHINKARGRDMSEDTKVEKERSNKKTVQKEKQIEATESELNRKLNDRKFDKLKSMLQIINPASCAKGRFWYGFGILFLMFFHFGNAGGGQHVISQFVRSFSIDQLKFSSADGTLINTSFWISFSIGRFIFFIMENGYRLKFLFSLKHWVLCVLLWPWLYLRMIIRLRFGFLYIQSGSFGDHYGQPVLHGQIIIWS